MFKKTACVALIVILVTVLGLQITQFIRKDPASLGDVAREQVPKVATYFLYRQDLNGEPRYWAMNGKTGLVELDSSDPVWLIETTLERVSTNSRVVFGGEGGWYLDRTLTIKGKRLGNPANEDCGLQEVIIDASQIEFIMHPDSPKDRDGIVIESVLGSEIYIGLIGGDPDDGYAALRIRPTLPVQHSGSIGAHWSKIRAQIISGEGSGVGVMLDGRLGKHGIQYMQVEVGSIAGFKTNILFDPGVNPAYGNEIKTIRNLTIVGGVGIQDGVTNTENVLFSNHYISGVSAPGGIGLSIYGNYSRYDLNVIDGDKGKIVVFEPGAWYNLVTGNVYLSRFGYTDNSGTDSNRVHAE